MASSATACRKAINGRCRFSPETLFKEGQKKKRERAELVGEERHEKEIQEQIERARSKQPQPEDAEAKDADPEKKVLQRDPNAGEKIAFAFGGLGGGGGGSGSSGVQKTGGGQKAGGSSAAAAAAAGGVGGGGLQVESKAGAAVFGVEDDDDVDGDDNGVAVGKKARRVGENGDKGGSKSGGGPAAGGTLAALMEEQERAKERANRKDYWLTEGIVVKIMSKALKEKGYYKQKGVVLRVIDRYVGEIKTLEEGHVVRVDQEELETVLPQIGGVVRVVNGAYRGSLAKLVGVDTEKFCAKVEIQKGAFDGRVIPRIDYEDICKVHVK
ncbi:unnamed protein product [Closterium sp. Naga37s-1]|nr:unnamed protein product [Closterium sp. Naga37s-1]